MITYSNINVYPLIGLLVIAILMIIYGAAKLVTYFVRGR
jgi:hypothetical protein